MEGKRVGASWIYGFMDLWAHGIGYMYDGKKCHSQMQCVKILVLTKKYIFAIGVQDQAEILMYSLCRGGH